MTPNQEDDMYENQVRWFSIMNEEPLAKDMDYLMYDNNDIGERYSDIDADFR